MLAIVDRILRTGALTAGPRPRTAPVPVAAVRSLVTIREVMACWRAIRFDARCGGSVRDRAEWLHEASHRVGDRLGLRLQVRGPVPQGAALLVANHMSYLDPIAIAQALPTGAVAKAELAGWPWLGSAIEQLGVVFVRRGHPASGATALLKAMRILTAGLPVLVFPEGTTTFGQDVLPFQRGAFGVAQLMGVPVVPIALRYSLVDACWVGDAAFLPHFFKLHRHRRLDVEVVFGAPIDPSRGADPSSIGKAARSQIQSVLHS